MKTNIYVLCGGKSVEHEVSLKSATAILNALNQDKYNVYPVFITKEGVWCNLGLLNEKIDNPEELQRKSSNSISNSIGDFLTKDFKPEEKNIIFPALHGPNGEDGTIQGFLELLNIPYVGNEVLSSSVSMDKLVVNELFTKHNIPQTPYTSLKISLWEEDEEKACEEIEKEINYPYYVKPANSGSSVGISRVANRSQLKLALKEAFLYDRKLVIEEEVIGREMQISVVGNDDPKVSVPGEFIMEKPFFDYNAKYIDGKLIPVVPANLKPEVSDKVRETAIHVFKVLNCYGLARVDIFVGDDDAIYVNEINTMPGFTPVSMTPVLWEATDGTTYAELVEWLIKLALERYEQKQNILNSFGGLND